MNPFIKICGICSRNDLEQICALKPEAVGFVFWPKSKRYVRPEQAAPWMDHIPDTLQKVGVFVEPTADVVEETARICQLDVIQIHLTSNDWKMNRPLFRGLETWLAPRMEENIKPALFSAVDPEPTRLLADHFDPNTIGGTGQVSNWNQVCTLRDSLHKPVLLAGGLTVSNVREAIERVQPWGVDVSSGVEKEPGIKDLTKVKKFIAAVRG